jgi:hypothetical protein
VRADVQVEQLTAKLRRGLTVLVRPDRDLDADRRWLLPHPPPNLAAPSARPVTDKHNGVRGQEEVTCVERHRCPVPSVTPGTAAV